MTKPCVESGSGMWEASSEEDELEAGPIGSITDLGELEPVVDQ